MPDRLAVTPSLLPLCSPARRGQEEEVVDDITAIVLQLRADEDGATVASGSASQDNTRA